MWEWEWAEDQAGRPCCSLCSSRRVCERPKVGSDLPSFATVRLMWNRSFHIRRARDHLDAGPVANPGSQKNGLGVALCQHFDA